MHMEMERVYLELKGEPKVEEIDIYSIISPIPQYGPKMTVEQREQFDRACEKARQPVFLELENDNPIGLSHRILPGDRVVSFDLDTGERHEYRLSNASEGFFKNALQSGSTVFAIVKTFEAQSTRAAC